jgi:hypothetical protein
MAKLNAKQAIEPVSTDSVVQPDVTIGETLTAEQAKVQADNEARLALAQQDIVDSIKSLSVDKNAVLASVVRTYSTYGNNLKPVSMPSKLAGSTEGKVLAWIMENPAKLIALSKAVTDDNAAKTSDQIIAKVIAVIKAHITVKPYAACF